jgi:hypothetical protein
MTACRCDLSAIGPRIVVIQLYVWGRSFVHAGITVTISFWKFLQAMYDSTRECAPLFRRTGTRIFLYQVRKGQCHSKESPRSSSVYFLDTVCLALSPPPTMLIKRWRETCDSGFADSSKPHMHLYRSGSPWVLIFHFIFMTNQTNFISASIWRAQQPLNRCVVLTSLQIRAFTPIFPRLVDQQSWSTSFVMKLPRTYNFLMID